jgi:hypothetical protein
VLRVLLKEQHHFAARTLPGITVPHSPGAIAKHILTPRALDLDETHARTTTMEFGNDESSGDPKCLKKN